MYSSLSVTTLVISVVLPILASLAVALRFHVRSIKKHSLSADDYFILAPLVRKLQIIISRDLLTYPGCIVRPLCFVSLWIDQSRGWRASVVEDDRSSPCSQVLAGTTTIFRRRVLLTLAKFMFADFILYVIAVCLIKISVILFYKRIFITRAFCIIANSIVGLSSVWLICFFLVG